MLKDHLIENILDVNAQSTREEVCSEIFKRIDSVPLMDKYVAYQILSENWEEVITDLEMIQGEGFDSIFKVDPNIVIKRKTMMTKKSQKYKKAGRGIFFHLNLYRKNYTVKSYMK